jgi:hypothetical protein
MALTVVQAGVGGTGLTSFPSPGASGNVLTSNGSAWTSSTPAGGGKVLQVVSASTSTAVVSTVTQTWIDTGITATITPTNSSSKILVLINLCGLWKSNSNLWNRAGIRMLRNGSLIGIEAYSQIATLTALEFRSGGLFYSKLDSPSTTSAVTYKLQFQTEYLSANDGIAVQKDSNSGESQIHLLEISA